MFLLMVPSSVVAYGYEHAGSFDFPEHQRKVEVALGHGHHCCLGDHVVVLILLLVSGAEVRHRVQVRKIVQIQAQKYQGLVEFVVLVRVMLSVRSSWSEVMSLPYRRPREGYRQSHCIAGSEGGHAAGGLRHFSSVVVRVVRGEVELLEVVEELPKEGVPGAGAHLLRRI